MRAHVTRHFSSGPKTASEDYVGEVVEEPTVGHRFVMMREDGEAVFTTPIKSMYVQPDGKIRFFVLNSVFEFERVK